MSESPLTWTRCGAWAWVTPVPDSPSAYQVTFDSPSDCPHGDPNPPDDRSDRAACTPPVSAPTPVSVHAPVDISASPAADRNGSWHGHAAPLAGRTAGVPDAIVTVALDGYLTSAIEEYVES